MGAALSATATHENAIPSEFDDEGFLKDSSNWTPEQALLIAELYGICKLTVTHWTIIYYVREDYFKIGAIPLMQRMCRANELNKEAIRELFDGCLNLWRVAGLPNPGEEAKTYMN